VDGTGAAAAPDPSRPIELPLAVDTAQGLSWWSYLILFVPTAVLPLIARTFDAGTPVVIGVSLVAIVGALAILYVALRIRRVRAGRRPARVDLVARTLIAGRRAVPFASITTATVIYGDMGIAWLSLRLGTGGRRGVTIQLRSAEVAQLDERQQAALIAAIEGSEIVLPVHPDDPLGRFRRFNLPGAVSKQEAVDVVRDPVSAGEYRGGVDGLSRESLGGRHPAR